MGKSLKNIQNKLAQFFSKNNPYFIDQFINDSISDQLIELTIENSLYAIFHYTDSASKILIELS